VASYEFLIGLRYTRAKRRNHFISFISLISLLGMTLGMTALITVMSVMNGFHKEVRARILGVASHAQISSYQGSLYDWEQIREAAIQNPQIAAAAPYIDAQGMLSHDNMVRGVMVRGILPADENRVADFAGKMVEGSLDRLAPGEFGIIIGQELARNLNAFPGNKIVLISPAGTDYTGRNTASSEAIYGHGYFRCRAL